MEHVVKQTTIKEIENVIKSAPPTKAPVHMDLLVSFITLKKAYFQSL